MNKEQFLDNVKRHNEYPDYRNFMGVINGIQPENVPKEVTNDKLIHGFCEDFAVYVAKKYGVELYDLGRSHVLMKLDGRYYDGYNVDGVDHLSDLQFVKTNKRYSDMPESKLLTMLVYYEKWSGYQVFIDAFGLIDKPTG